MFVSQLKSVGKERGETDVQSAFRNIALLPKVKKYILGLKLLPNFLTAQEISVEKLSAMFQAVMYLWWLNISHIHK